MRVQNEGSPGTWGPSEKEEKTGQEVRGAGCQDSENLDKAYFTSRCQGSCH